MKRCTAAASLLLHLLVLVVLPLAHARLEAAESERTLHIEAERDGGCAPRHDALTCEICRTLRAPARAPLVSTLEVSPAVVPQPNEPHRTASPAPTSNRLALRSRAPPQSCS